jgi:hypothetical protein
MELVQTVDGKIIKLGAVDGLPKSLVLDPRILLQFLQPLELKS